MPLSADPNDTISYVLETDRGGVSPAPEFHLRYLTVRERRRAAQLVAAAAEEKDDEAAEAKLNQAIEIGLAEIVNVRCRGEEMSIDTPPGEYLTSGELWELAYAVLREPRLSEQKKRSSGSPPTSGSDSSAPNAPAASAPTAAA